MTLCTKYECPDAPGCEEHGCYWEWATEMSSVGPVGEEMARDLDSDVDAVQMTHFVGDDCPGGHREEMRRG